MVAKFSECEPEKQFTVNYVILICSIAFIMTKCAVVDEKPFKELDRKIRDFTLTSELPVQKYTFSINRHVREDSISEAIEEVVRKAVFVSTFDFTESIIRLDERSLLDSTFVEATKLRFRDFLRPLIKPGSSLVDVDWVLSDYPGFTTVAVLSEEGDVIYEPILDAGHLEVRHSTGYFSGNSYSRADTAKWFNMLDNLKAWTSLIVTSSGSDGCQASFSTNVKNWSEFPFIVKGSDPNITKYCEQKNDCLCREQPDSPDRLECARGDVDYNIILRIGTQWFGADIHRYGDVLTTDLCANEPIPDIAFEVEAKKQSNSKK